MAQTAAIARLLRVTGPPPHFEPPVVCRLRALLDEDGLESDWLHANKKPGRASGGTSKTRGRGHRFEVDPQTDPVVLSAATVFAIPLRSEGQR